MIYIQDQYLQFRLTFEQTQKSSTAENADKFQIILQLQSLFSEQ